MSAARVRARPHAQAAPAPPSRVVDTAHGGQAAAVGAHRFSLGVWSLVALALGLRLWHVWSISGSPFAGVLLGDAKGYDAWARRLASGQWLGTDVFYQAPLYPYVLGLIYRLLGSSIATARVVQALLGAAACGLLALATRRFFDEVTGLVAGLALALYAPAIFFDGLLQKSVLDTLVMAAVLWFAGGLAGVGAFADRPSRLRWFGLGVCLGLLSLTRENALVLVVVVGAWLVMRRDAPGTTLRARGLAAAVCVLGLALPLTPVLVRNAVVSGGFYLTTSQFGPNFFIGNNPQADGTYASLRYGRGTPEFEQQDATTLAEHASGRSLTPAEVSSYWSGRAFTFIVAEPGRWLALEARKALLLVNRTEMLDTESQESYATFSPSLRLLGRVGHFGLLMPLALFGAVLAWSRRPRTRVLHALALAYVASVLLFYVFARYRLPLVPLLLPWVATACTWLWQRARGAAAWNRTTAAALASALLVAVPANWPLLSSTLNQAVTETNLGTELQASGRLADAVAHYQQAVALEPTYAPAYNNLGVALRAQGRLTEAIDTYRRALAQHADYPDAHYNLANALLASGDAAGAETHFTTALTSIPDEAGIRNNLGLALAAQGKPEQALAAVQSAVAAAPDSAIAHRNLGDMLVAAGRAPEGIVELERATALAPGDATAHYNLGVALLSVERLDEAVRAFRKALSITPDSEDAHTNLGIALGGLGRVREAEAEFRAALALNPSSSDARDNLALLERLLAARAPGTQRP